MGSLGSVVLGLQPFFANVGYAALQADLMNPAVDLAALQPNELE